MKKLNGLAFGIWDLLHVGHVRFLENANKICNHLTVAVPTDQVVVDDKGGKAIIPFAQRIEMVSALRCVDTVVAYATLDFLPVLHAVKPAVLFVGEDWGSDRRHQAAEEFMSLPDREPSCFYNKSDATGRPCGIWKLPRCEEVSTSWIIKEACHCGPR